MHADVCLSVHRTVTLPELVVVAVGLVVCSMKWHNFKLSCLMVDIVNTLNKCKFVILCTAAPEDSPPSGAGPTAGLKAFPTGPSLSTIIPTVDSAGGFLDGLTGTGTGTGRSCPLELEDRANALMHRILNFVEAHMWEQLVIEGPIKRPATF